MYNTIRDVNIFSARVGINFHISASGGYINANQIENIAFDNCSYPIGYQNDVATVLMANSNHIRNVIAQSETDASGVGKLLAFASGVNGVANEFISCDIYDMLSGSITYSITTSANHTMIIGGNAPTQNNMTYINSGQNTKVWAFLDGFNMVGPVTLSGISNFKGTIIPTATFDLSGGNSNILDLRNSASGQTTTIRMMGQSGRTFDFSIYSQTAGLDRVVWPIYSTTAIIAQSQRFNTSGLMRPFVFNFLDNANTTTIEPLRLTTSGNVEFNRSGGAPLFNNYVTSGATTGSGGTVPGAAAGWLNIIVSGNTVKIPFFNV